MLQLSLEGAAKSHNEAVASTPTLCPCMTGQHQVFSIWTTIEDLPQKGALQSQKDWHVTSR